MNRRENFNKIINHEEYDHVPVDLGKHIGSFHQLEYKKLKEYLKDDSMKNENEILDRMAQTVFCDETLLQRFNIDFRWLYPNLSSGMKNESENTYRDMWGVGFKLSGDYWAVDDSPLSDAETIEDINNYHWPYEGIPAMFKGLKEKAKYLYENTDYVIGADGVKAGILMTALQLRGYENLLVDTLINKEFAEALFDKILDVLKKMWSEYLKEVGPYVQLVYLTDDVGTQTSTLISPELFKELLKDRNKELISHIKSLADVKVMFHSDGAVLPILDDFIEMGVDILNPVQTSVIGLDDTFKLKEKYGDRLCFHGAIDVQQILPNASKEQIKEEVHKRIYDLGRKGGYICAACHNIGHDIPVENIVAMYEAAEKFGKYPLTSYKKD